METLFTIVRPSNGIVLPSDHIYFNKNEAFKEFGKCIIDDLRLFCVTENSLETFTPEMYLVEYNLNDNIYKNYGYWNCPDIWKLIKSKYYEFGYSVHKTLVYLDGVKLDYNEIEPFMIFTKH